MNDPKNNQGNEMRGCLGAALYVMLWVACGALWLSAVISDASNSRIAWLLVDILVAPLGVIRGMILWLT